MPVLGDVAPAHRIAAEPAEVYRRDVVLAAPGPEAQPAPGRRPAPTGAGVHPPPGRPRGRGAKAGGRWPEGR
ncbi:hypothetical protein ACFFSH_13460 [Streptomyces filamentosus]|uniref:hypothetical protein n=1 Tax=Streptomyces filamentosus TaxID=67294 RepID=UPI00167BBD8A|nr:hypothetical protein [Streptomyces filamentosus]